MVFLDGSKDCFAEEVQCTTLVSNFLIHPECHVRKKRRLGTSKVISAICIEYLAVVFDAKAEVLDHRLGQISPFVDD